MDKPLLVVVEDNPNIESYSTAKILEFTKYYDIQQEFIQKIVRSSKKELDFFEQHFGTFNTKLAAIKKKSIIAVLDLNLWLDSRDYLELISKFNKEIISFLEVWCPDQEKTNIVTPQDVMNFLNQNRLTNDIYKSLGGLCFALTILKNKQINSVFIDIASSNDADAQLVVEFIEKEKYKLGRSDDDVFVKRNQLVWREDTRSKILEEDFNDFNNWQLAKSKNQARSFHSFSSTIKEEAKKRGREGIHIKKAELETTSHYQLLANFMNWELEELITGLGLKENEQFIEGHIVNNCLKAFANSQSNKLTLMGLFMITWAFCRKKLNAIDQNIHQRFLNKYTERILRPYIQSKQNAQENGQTRKELTLSALINFSREKNMLPYKNDEDYIATIQSLEELFEVLLLSEDKCSSNIDDIELIVNEKCQKFTIRLTNISDGDRLMNHLISYNRSALDNTHPTNSTSGKLFNFFLHFHCGSRAESYPGDITVYGSKGIFRIEKPAESNHRINLVFEI